MTALKNPLAEYNAKRDFSQTPEPSGIRESSETGNHFIVQKHQATRLHWDLRLEVDGVLRSWAVTKGPSPDPDIKRLAVRTEDHPMSYAEFEGAIPKGEYGGGTIMLWDRGSWAPVEGKSAKDLAEGHLHFILNGERMKGEWLLIRLKRKPGEKRENWLLRKVRDEYARDGDALVQRELTSVLTGRSMAEIAADKDGKSSRRGQHNNASLERTAKGGLRNSQIKKDNRIAKREVNSPPKFRKPQLATLVNDVPQGNGWMHEIKFDGYRAIVAAASDKVHIFTRSGKNWTDKFGPLAAKFAALKLPACLIDGEIVAHDENGNPSFSILQKVLKRGHESQAEDDKLAFHAFDLIETAGEDLAGLPNLDRKERLETLLVNVEPPIYVADHVIGAGEKLYRAMCDAEQEGIISKKIDAPYNSRRSRSWVKVKCTQRQDFTIIGWKKSAAKGRPFASLLLAQYEGNNLVYKGNVGTGFSSEDFDSLAGKLRRLQRKSPPAEVDNTSSRGVIWVTPKLVAEIAFSEFTADGNVRHGSYLGLRGEHLAAQKKQRKIANERTANPAVTISSRERIIFPDSGQTKGDLADYYEAVGEIMLPFAGYRPISLVRCPQGRAKKCFFQKHDSGSFGPHVHHVPIRENDGNTEDYLYLKDTRGLLACVQMGTIEFHGWASRSDVADQPDRMIFDLDPDESLDFNAVKLAALDLRDRLSDLGLVTFAMMSGGKGVHVVVPLRRGHDWGTHKDFARRFAEALSLSEPERFTAAMSKAQRKGKIFVDWLRNQRGSTAILPYSARARSGAPVATPMAWNELKTLESARPYSIDDAEILLARAASKSLSGWGFAEQPLPNF